jgi:hypothetical protein
MKKIVFDFLDQMQLKEIEKTPTQIKASQQPAKGADFRLFADGAIYPSEEIAKRHQLEYPDKDATVPAYGYDVFLSTAWSQFPAGLPPVVMLAKVSKAAAKVDLFSRVKYDKVTNKPLNSVVSQRNTSGEELIKLLEAVYCEQGETLFANGKVFVDLKIAKQLNPLPNGIYHIPKKVEKGKQAGAESYERRENIDVFLLDIVEADESKVSHTNPVVGTAAPVTTAAPAQTKPKVQPVNLLD